VSKVYAKAMLQAEDAPSSRFFEVMTDGDVVREYVNHTLAQLRLRPRAR
jgi:hypothetical protein